MTSFEDTIRHAIIGFALDGIAAHKALLDAVGYRPTTDEERDACQDSEASPIAAALEERRPARVFPPAVFIREEMAARGWDAERLAKEMPYGIHVVRTLIDGRCPINELIAARLGNAFGTSTEVWLNLQRNYDKWHAEKIQAAMTGDYHGAVDALGPCEVEPS